MRASRLHSLCGAAHKRVLLCAALQAYHPPECRGQCPRRNRHRCGVPSPTRPPHTMTSRCRPRAAAASSTARPPARMCPAESWSSPAARDKAEGVRRREEDGAARKALQAKTGGLVSQRKRTAMTERSTSGIKVYGKIAVAIGRIRAFVQACPIWLERTCVREVARAGTAPSLQ